MATFAGGEHSAELIATDGAGNVTKKVWMINVDPKGSVGATEVKNTLEAVEVTDPLALPVAPTPEVIGELEREEGNDPGLEEVADEQFVSTGTAAEVKIDAGLDEAITIDAPEGDVEISSLGPQSAATSKVVEGAAAVLPNTAIGTDTIVRPKYNGALAFQSIREPSASETYSWEVTSLPGQTLQTSSGGQYASLYYEDGTQAMLIEAMPAADAVGHAVPTHLSVAGNVMTLTVEHKGSGVVYPVLAGPAFEVGTITVEVVIPPPPPSEPEKEMEPERVEFVEGSPIPEPTIPDPEAGASSARKTKHKDSEMTKCQTEVCLFGFWEKHFKERFLYNGTYHVPGSGQAWHDNGEKSWHDCSNYSDETPFSIELGDCKWIGNHALYGPGGHYICAQDIWYVHDHATTEFHAMTFHDFGDGYVGKHQNSACTP